MINKKIIIKNNKDLKRFYNKLNIYKRIFYINTFFETNNDEIKKIIDILNIKNRKKRITYIYDSACKYIDDYWDGKNVCGFKNGRCYAHQYPGCKYKNGCCRKCVYQSSKGCVTSNLTCKLYYCSEVIKRYEVPTMKSIKITKLLSWRQRIILKHDYFSSREEVLKDLYIDSTIIFTIRLLYRWLTNNIV